MDAGGAGGGAGGVGLVGSVPVEMPGSHISTNSSAAAKSGYVTAGKNFSTGAGVRGFINSPTLTSGGGGGGPSLPVIPLLIVAAVVWLALRWMK